MIGIVQREENGLPVTFMTGPEETLRGYDILGRMTQETLPNGNIRTQTFNGLSTTVKLEAGSTQQKIETRNALGQLIETLDNDGSRMTYQYDPFGNRQMTRKVSAA